MQTIAPLWLWLVFVGFVLAALFVDFVLLKKQGAHEVGVKQALNWSLVWVGLSFVFNALFWWAVKDSTGSSALANEKSLEFLTGYLIEKSLAVDNIFVFLLIFSYFSVPQEYQHRVLFWGILGALVMRAIFIAAGAALIASFHWIIYVFGAFLILTGIKMAFAPDQGLEPEKNPVVRLVRRLFPVSDRYHGQAFFVREKGVLTATPLFLVLALVETTDLIFAVDSIPAIFAVTRDPFIVYTSNVFAILGLRSLYFLLAGVMAKFEYLKLGLAAILVFVGAKMALVDWVKIPSGISLGVIAAILAVAIGASLLNARRAMTA